MTGSGIDGGGNLIRGNFGGRVTGLDTANPLIEATDTQSAAYNFPNLRPKLGKLSEGNDPFKELATRLTDFFSKPESENNKAQEIKNACWNDLPLENKPVFEPNFENLTGAKFSKNPEGGLTITLSPAHVDQGYLQVLSDLTLVAEVIKRSIDKSADQSIGFNSSPIEKIKIITHPDRNLVIPVEKITRNLDYKIGPEFKLIESENYGLIPVANGMFNLSDVETGKLKAPNNNNNHLEKLAFNESDNNVLPQITDLRKTYFTAFNKLFVSPMNESHRAYKIIQDAFEYRKPTENFENIIREHNKGRIYDHMNPPAISRSTEASPLDSSYNRAVRQMGLHQRKDSETFIHRSPEIFTNEQLSQITKLDSLKLLTHGVNLQYPDGNTVLPKYAFSSPGLVDRIQKIV
jgi:hypothetical protein